VPQDALLLIQHREVLLQWGFRIGEDGNDIVVHAIPATVAPIKTEAALLHIAAALRDAGGTLPSDWREQMLITLACHTSIRAGQRLSLAEQQALLTQMQQCTNPRTCPHCQHAIGFVCTAVRSDYVTHFSPAVLVTRGVCIFSFERDSHE
jgi:DNA mismatch repair protein MutL